MSMIDISLGGALGTLDGADNPSIFTVGGNLKDVELVFPHEAKTVSVHIKEAVVRRTGKNPATGREVCAIQFIDILKRQRRKLVKLIYDIQRDYLRRRVSG